MTSRRPAVTPVSADRAGRGERPGQGTAACAVAPSASQPRHDPVDHPRHYTAHPSGIECIEITEHMGFCLGNAVKYIWRADLKADAIEDLRKARWYLDREIERRETAWTRPAKP